MLHDTSFPVLTYSLGQALLLHDKGTVNLVTLNIEFQLNFNFLFSSVLYTLSPENLLV